MTSSAWQRFMQGDSCPECGCPIMEMNDDDGNREGLCCTQCDWMQFDNPAEHMAPGAHDDLPPGPLEVTIVGNGDPEVFAAREVEILVSGHTYMIEPGEWGGLLIRTPGVVLPYHLGATCVERSAIRVNVYVTAADEAKARAAQEKTGD